MKIDEPKTPFEAYESDGEDGKEELDANLLAARISAEGHKGPRPRRYAWSSFVVPLCPVFPMTNTMLLSI